MKPMTPRTLDWIDQAPAKVSQTRRIAASPDAVWAVVADHANWPTWFPGLKKVVPGETAEGVGGSRTVHLTGMAVEEEFLAWDPGAHFAFTGTGATRGALESLVESVRLAADGDSATTVTYTVALKPSGPSIVGTVVAKIMKQATGKGLAGLAEQVEGTS